MLQRFKQKVIDCKYADQKPQPRQKERPSLFRDIKISGEKENNGAGKSGNGPNGIPDGSVDSVNSFAGILEKANHWRVGYSKKQQADCAVLPGAVDSSKQLHCSEGKN